MQIQPRPLIISKKKELKADMVRKAPPIAISALPAMTASAAGPTEHCVVYAEPDGSTRIQLGNGSWIGLREDLGWLILVETEAAAVPLVLTTDPSGACGATWQARTPDGTLATVSYTTDGVDPDRFETTHPLIHQGSSTRVAPAEVVT